MGNNSLSNTEKSLRSIAKRLFRSCHTFLNDWIKYIFSRNDDYGGNSKI